MTIHETKAGNYRVEVFFPKNVRDILANGESRFRKTVPTKAEAQRLEREIQTKIETVTQTGTDRVMSIKGEISFKDFYETLWLPLYEAGGSGRIRTIPTKATVEQTKSIFRLHLLPLFGSYSLTYLNEHNQFVMQELAILGEQYANIKTIKSYVGQLFDVAEAADFIEVNRIAKILRFINAPKKKRLHDKRVAEGEALTADELIAWIDAARTDLDSGKLSEEEYLLFVLTLNLGDRKSESYGLRWRYVDLENGYIYVMNALNKHKELGPTKGHKQTKIEVPEFIVELLQQWKEHQADELASVGITKLDGEQFVFTYTDNRGHMNQPLHADFLNYRLNSIEKRHPTLRHAYPHKLRHTYSTLALEGGATMEAISAALTHSDVTTTRIYVNTPDIVSLTTNNMFAKRIAEARAKAEAKEMASHLS